MNVGFDPSELCPDASLNRTLIGGTPAFELLSAEAVAELVGDPGADQVGRRLAALLAALKTADARDGLGVPATPWRKAYLTHWRSISQVWLAGGTTARFGTALAEATGRHLADLGVRDLTVRSADHPALLPLIGAARSVAAPVRAAVFDFGHTLAKRGVARYDHHGCLTEIELRPPVLLDVRSMTPDEVLDAVRSIIDSTLTGAEPVDHVVVSLAAYVRHGEPDDRRGAYGALRSYHLSCRPRWVHDATAASRAVAAHTPTAVITLGTALGVGFAPDPSTVTPAASALTIV